MTPQTLRLPRRPLGRSLLLLGLSGGLTGLLLPAPARAQAAAAPAPAASTTAALDAFVQKTMDARQLPSVSVAVIQDGKVVAAKGYGFADVEKSVKATEQTVYQLASVTKQFTAMAILMLVEEGKLSLDTKVSTILPGLPESWAPVTIRHLLTHTSGIKSYTDVFGQQKVADSRVFTSDEILALVKDAPMQFAPGEKVAYCNTGYYLLGMVIEKVSAKPYGQFVAERIFTPLGMTASGYDDYADARPVRAVGYSTVNGQTKPAEHTHPSQPFAAGALVSTIVDLAKWDAALSARKLLEPATYNAMWRPMRLNDGKPSTYAFGWSVEPYRGHARQSHGGGISGFSTFIARFPDDRVTIVALVNQSGGAAGSLVNGIAEIYIPALKDAAPKPIADSDAKLTEFLRQVLSSASQGSADAANLTPEFAGILLPDRVKQGPQMMGRHGALTAFDLMEESTKDARRIRVYRAVFGTTPLRIMFTVTADGKIAGLGVGPDN